MSDISHSNGVADPVPADFWTLLKPRVMSLVIFTALAGVLLAPGDIHPILAIVSLCAIAVGAGASGALNMGFDADIDAIMNRTANRPVPAGRVGREEALTFGAMLSVLSVMVLTLSANPLAAALLAFTIFFYVVIYTLWLKRWTPQNIVIGGAAGALPPVVGWAAVTGSLAWEPVLMFLIIFVWTPAHFWALAILTRDDYARARLPMLPVVASARTTRINIFVYALLTAVTGVLPAVFGYVSPLYGVIAAGLGVWFGQRAWALIGANEDNERRLAGKTFAVSIIYLFAIFGAMMADHLVTGLL
ncbi:MAG: heme o synthase [Pseudomonadota bacterium]